MVIVAKYSGLVARNPVNFFFCELILIFVVCALAVVTGHLKIAENTEFDMTVYQELTSIHHDAFSDAINSLEFLTTETASAENRTSPYQLASLQVLYQLDTDPVAGAGIFTPKIMQSICNTDKVFTEGEGYDKVCMKSCPQESCECAPQMQSVSVLVYSLTEPEKYEKCELITESALKGYVDIVRNAVEDPTSVAPQFRGLGFFVDSEFQDDDVPKSNWTATKTRSLILYGGPIEKNILPANASRFEISDYYNDNFMQGAKETFFKKFGMEEKLFHSAFLDPAKLDVSEDTVVDVMILSSIIAQDEFLATIQTDILAVMGSVVLVATMMVVHTKSLFIGPMGMLQVFLSIPVTLTIYFLLFQISYFGNFHILAMFLILGIGADDVYVMSDYFHLTSTSDSLEKRLTSTITHTLGAVFNTSMTTAIAFYATAFTPVMPISTFGVFAGTAILVNYFLCVTFTPVIVAVWHVKFANRSYKEILTCSAPSETVVLTAKTVNSETEIGDRNSKDVESASTESAKSSTDDDTHFDHHHHGFWGDTWAAWLNLAPEGRSRLKPFSMLLTLGLAGLTAAFSYQAFQLEKPVEQDAFFSEASMLTRSVNSAANDYLSAESSRYISMNMVFGIKGIDRTGFNRLLPLENRGSAIYESGFTLSTKEKQLAFVNTCQKLREATCASSIPCLDGKLLLSQNVPCVIEGFHAYQKVQQNSSTIVYSEGANFVTDLKMFLASPGGSLYGKFVGFDPNDSSKIQMVYIPLIASIKVLQPHGVTRPYYDTIEAFLDEHVRNDFPEAYVENSRDFGWLITQEKLVAGLFNGFAISFPVAFGVLMIATQNIVISAYATLSVTSIVGCVMGTTKLLGWYLGMTETVAGVLIIGFSVDFSIHLSHVYETSSKASKGDRGKRVQEALATMGHTVIGGALTTFASGAVMFICQLTVFGKMATLICITMGFSCVFSLGFLMALLALVGPENDTGDVLATCRSNESKEVE